MQIHTVRVATEGEIRAPRQAGNSAASCPMIHMPATPVMTRRQSILAPLTMVTSR